MALKKTGKAVIMAQAQVNMSPSFAMYVYAVCVGNNKDW